MTNNEFNDIDCKLEQWRNIRRITKEEKREELIHILLEKTITFSRTKNVYERVDAICEIIIFLLNSYDINYKEKDYKKAIYTNRKVSIITLLSNWLLKHTKKTKTIEASYGFVDCLISLSNLGFDSYKCLLEKHKEIFTKSGYYDEFKKEFIKDISEETKACWYKADFSKCKL